MTTAVHGVSLDAGKETYTLRYSFNAICSAEQRAGRELTMMGEMENGPQKNSLSMK